MMIVIETDHNAYTEDTKSQRKIQMAEEMREAAGEDEQVLGGCLGKEREIDCVRDHDY